MAEPADRIVHALKYGGWPRLADVVAGRMLEAIRCPPGFPEGLIIVPIPTTSGRLRRRGYNQARLLARAVSEGMGVALLDALHRRAEGASQVALHPSERWTNVAGAFTLRPGIRERIRGGHLLLVDDVLTTGATAAAAATVLGDGGAATVRLVTFARSLP